MSQLLQRLFQGSRVRLAVIAAVLIVLALSGTVLALSTRGSPSVSQPPQAAIVDQATATGTGTATSTLTPRPTATQRPKSQAKQHTNPTAPKVPTPPPSPTPCPTPTSLPQPTATDTPVPTATDTGTPAGLRIGGNIQAMAAACQPCPYYKGNNPTQSSILSALNTAADAYGLPRNLLQAVAWQESRWHEDVTSCDGGIGLMQVQYYTYPWLNSQSVSACGLGTTNYDPYTLQGNAYLGAKFLKWLSCFYSYWGSNGGTSLSSPGQYTIAWYYQQAGLRYPDTKNADGSTNDNSLCAAVFNSSSVYAALPSNTSQPWSCPYSATTGDNTLLDATLSAYNEGPDNFNKYGVLNPGYVSGVEGFIPQFASGTLP